MDCKNTVVILQNGRAASPESIAVISSGYAVIGQAGMLSTGAGKRPASPERKKLVTERTPSLFQNAIGSKTCNEREEKDTDFPETCKAIGNSCLICRTRNGMIRYRFVEKCEEKSKAAAMPAQRNGR